MDLTRHRRPRAHPHLATLVQWATHPLMEEHFQCPEPQGYRELVMHLWLIHRLRNYVYAQRGVYPSAEELTELAYQCLTDTQLRPQIVQQTLTEFQICTPLADNLPLVTNCNRLTRK